MPNVGAGIYAYGKKYYIGFSVPHLIPGTLNKFGVATGSAVAHQYNQYLFTAGYVFGKDASIVKFRPTFLMKYQAGLSFNVPDFYFNAGLLFIDRIWLIAGVKTGNEGNGVLSNNLDKSAQKKFGVEGVVGMVQAKITPQLAVGYAYNYALSHLAHYETGTHEVMIGYQFWYNKKRFVTPRYVKYF
jgi:type IX secretion system PorP/SprF family membrane protein